MVCYTIYDMLHFDNIYHVAFITKKKDKWWCIFTALTRKQVALVQAISIITCPSMHHSCRKLNLSDSVWILSFLMAWLGVVGIGVSYVWRRGYICWWIGSGVKNTHLRVLVLSTFIQWTRVKGWVYEGLLLCYKSLIINTCICYVPVIEKN